jgi:twitching motility protein PilT
LLPRCDGPGRALAIEVLTMTPAIRNLIRESKNHQIYSTMQQGMKDTGSLTMNHSLLRLHHDGAISWETMMSATPDKAELEKLKSIQSY